MIVLGLLLGLVIILQAFILFGICRIKDKVDELRLIEATDMATLGLIGENMQSITHIIDQQADNIITILNKLK